MTTTAVKRIEFTKPVDNETYETVGNKVQYDDGVIDLLANAIAAAIITNEAAVPQFGVDAGGRQRVSTVTTLGDYKHTLGANGLFMNSATVGTGAATHDATIPGMTLTTSANNDVVVHQSKQWHNYQSGKSHQIEMTCIRFGYQSSIIKSLGYYSSTIASPFAANYDGIYVESNGLTNEYSFVIVKNGVETARLPRSLWYDPLNGSGPSGINAVWDNFTVFAMDFLWLGGTDFRLWYKYDNAFYLAAIYHHAGHEPFPAILSPNQPIRYEMRQVGAGSGVFDMICAQVSSEGAINEWGTTRSFSTGVGDVNANAIGTYYAVVGVKLRTSTRGVVALPKKISLLETSGANNDYHWRLLLNPTVAGAFVYNLTTNTNLDVAIGNTATSPSPNTVTGGVEMDGGYGSESTPVSQIIDTALRIGSTVAGVMDELVLVVSPTSVNQQILGSLTTFEFS